MRSVRREPEATRAVPWMLDLPRVTALGRRQVGGRSRLGRRQRQEARRRPLMLLSEHSGHAGT